MASGDQTGVRCGRSFSTYPDLFGRALRASRGLHELGIGGGDRVALLLRNSLEFLEASIATVPLGASAVPVNWHWRGDEIAHVLSDSGAKALVVHADLWPAIAPSVPDGVALIVVPTPAGPIGDPPAGALLWPEWLAGHEPWAQAPETGPASIIYTSGTTGRPKGVVRAQPTESQREQVRSRYDLSSLRWVVHAAAPCPPDVKRAMIEWLGPIVAEYYGGTETGPVAFCTSEEWLAHPGTVGRPLERAVVKVLDAEGNELPAGQSGEIYMWLDVWPDFSYAGDEEKRRSVERDGLVSCGDIGYLDTDGYLHLNDRRSDMVISGGVNIYPAEIEACLLAMPGVRDCAVFGIPDDEFGEALAAYVEPQNGAQLNDESVRAHVRSRLAAYKTPRLVEFRDSLPREDTGKIFKRRLRDPYWAGRERAI